MHAFVNRTDELGRLNAILTAHDGSRLVVSVHVVAGTAGAGKTSLALHWAHQVKDHFPDGQLFVNLRGYDPGEPLTAHQALHGFLRALGVPTADVPPGVDDAAALYRSLLADRRVLVLLDNAATAGQVRPLLPGSGGSLVVVTSRSRLSGLAVRDGARRLTLGMLPEREAIALLRAVTSDYRPDDDERQLSQLASLCARLPLALRIAAERAASHPHLRLDDLITDLTDESALWDTLSTGSNEDAEAVRTVFAWSYRLIGLIHLDTRRLDLAAEHFGHAGALFRDLNRPDWVATALSNAATTHHAAGRFPEAMSAISQALDVHRSLDDKPGIGNALSLAAELHCERGEITAARAAVDEALEIALSLRNHRLEGFWLLTLGAIQRTEGDHGNALTSHQRSAMLHRRLGDRRREALAWRGTGLTYTAMEREEEAAAFHRQAACVHGELGDTWQHAVELDHLAAAVHVGDPEAARTHWAEALTNLAPYTDPRATAVRSRIEQRLTTM